MRVGPSAPLNQRNVGDLRSILGGDRAGREVDFLNNTEFRVPRIALYI